MHDFRSAGQLMTNSLHKYPCCWARLGIHSNIHYINITYTRKHTQTLVIRVITRLWWHQFRKKKITRKKKSCSFVNWLHTVAIVHQLTKYQRNSTDDNHRTNIHQNAQPNPINMKAARLIHQRTQSPSHSNSHKSLSIYLCVFTHLLMQMDFNWHMNSFNWFALV